MMLHKVIELLNELAQDMSDRGTVNDDYDQGYRTGLAFAEDKVRLVLKNLQEPTQVPEEEHLEIVVEAFKCSQFLATSANQHQPIEIERLIDAADQLADRYAQEYLSHLSKDEFHKAIEELVAEQARKVMDYIVKQTTCPKCGSTDVSQFGCSDCKEF